MSAERIDPREAREGVASGKALLVSAYDDPEMRDKHFLDGSISLDDLRQRSVGKDQELIFYCA